MAQNGWVNCLSAVLASLMTRIALRSTLTCPHCGHRETRAMPQNACLYFHSCAGCGIELKPLPGDCCVFCSYGSIPCPPRQHAARR